MPKTLPPGTADVAGRSFRLDVVPDVFDARDLEYRPRLSPLQPVVDVRPGHRHVMTQEGSSCTGHAVAAMINAVLAGTSAPVKVSPYMLYRMARRYDEWEGEEDDGSSLRGALKGWYYHGVLPVEDWPRLDEDCEPDLDLDEALAVRALERPLGAFYRVNAYRLDDLQSAVTELHGIVVSAAIHNGWLEPVLVQRDGQELHVIERPVDASPLGGHAFAVVGYNAVGFLVQNSWGAAWGKGGFATLPYEDWLSSAYDAWVARPGVRTVVSLREQTKVVTSTGGQIAAGPGPDLVRLQRHVVNLGNRGRLSGNGRFRSSPRQLELVVERMRDYHERWPGQGPRRLVLYAHGGLNSDRTGLTVAHSQLNWWLNNHVYPITFAWQTGAAESLLDHLSDTVRDKLPFGGPGIDLVEQVDRLVEKAARSHVRWMWDEMKENAAAASAPLHEDHRWPAEGGARELADLPGGSLLVDLLASYCRSARDVEVHLVGHSAGSIFLAALLQELVRRQVPVASLTYLAPAIRVDTFERLVLPHLQAGRVARFASFALTDRRELDDVCGAGRVTVYQKSLLYLVSRALESGGDRGRSSGVPLLGMQRFHRAPRDGAVLADLLEATGRSELVYAPSSHPPRSRSDSLTHAGFDDDPATMTSVLLRVLGHDGEPTQRMGFLPNAPLLDLDAAPSASGQTDHPPVEQPLAVQDSRDAGEVPVTVTATTQPGGVDVPDVDEGRLPERRVAPRSTSPVMDALLREGWRRAGGG